MLNRRIHHKDIYPLLSCAGIEQFLSRFVQRRNITNQEVICQLEHRHRKRLDAIEPHCRTSKRRELPWRWLRLRSQMIIALRS